jgi:hypothetical protein
LLKVARDLKSGKYSGLSHGEIKKKILARFWKPAKPIVAKWLDSKLGQSQKALPPILSQNGLGVAFVSEKTFNALEKEVLSYCNK